MQPNLTPTQIDTAKRIISNPHANADRPCILQMAWADLKQARGQLVDFNRLPNPHYIIEPSERSARITAKVRKIAADKDYLPRPPLTNGAA